MFVFRCCKKSIATHLFYKDVLNTCSYFMDFRKMK